MDTPRPTPETPVPGPNSPAPAVVLGHLAENLPYLTRAMRAYIRVENAEHFGDLDTEHGEIATLALISLNPGISQNDLAAKVVLKKSAVTQLIKSLERRGLVQRRKSSADRRFNALTLTAEGERRHAALIERIDRQHDAVLAPFSPTERTALFAALGRLLASLEARHEARTGSRAAAKLSDDS